MEDEKETRRLAEQQERMKAEYEKELREKRDKEEEVRRILEMHVVPLNLPMIRLLSSKAQEC